MWFKDGDLDNLSSELELSWKQLVIIYYCWGLFLFNQFFFAIILINFMIAIIS
jgi:hypothetical protein